jgi:hypothetical protein
MGNNNSSNNNSKVNIKKIKIEDEQLAKDLEKYKTTCTFRKYLVLDAFSFNLYFLRNDISDNSISFIDKNDEKCTEKEVFRYTFLFYGMPQVNINVYAKKYYKGISGFTQPVKVENSEIQVDFLRFKEERFGLNYCAMVKFTDCLLKTNKHTEASRDLLRLICYLKKIPLDLPPKYEM